MKLCQNKENEALRLAHEIAKHSLEAFTLATDYHN